MSKKKLYNKGGIVYSTGEDLNSFYEEEPVEFLPKEEQKLSVTIDKKQRGGKIVSLIKGFSMEESEIEDLARKLKSFCGTGGSAKNNEIIIQGDQREKIIKWLLENGYKKPRTV